MTFKKKQHVEAAPLVSVSSPAPTHLSFAEAHALVCSTKNSTLELVFCMHFNAGSSPSEALAAAKAMVPL